MTSDGVEPPSWTPDFEQVTSQILGDLGVDGWDISVLLCDSTRIAGLNQEYRSIPGPTDVLTFSQTEGSTIPGAAATVAGDIVIAPEVVETNATSYAVSREEEMLRVYIHALLHLMGYTHDGVDISQEMAKNHPMLSLQEKYVGQLQKEKEN